ncbi:ribosome alternative rescue factor ArfA [bacterium AH-315-B06]|nr:ribosome alternative rescue factor ArfA [bacterium AH-315-B06]
MYSSRDVGCRYRRSCVLHDPIARALRTPMFRQRKIRPKKGKGNYSRARRFLA